MKIIMLLTLLIPAGTESGNDIITRHDKSDEAYIKFAQELPVTSAVVRYSRTDVAGTLIAPQWILSAAHVANSIEPGRELILGNDSLEVEKVVIHPEWRNNSSPQDIALIKIKTPVHDIISISLFKNRDEIDKEVILIGNGDFGTGITGVRGNDGKFRAATNTVDDATNDFLIWNFEDPRENAGKVTDMEGISGPGDSSGPALIQIDDQFFIAGISSRQRNDGIEGIYGVTEYYTRVSTYASWIENIISG